MRCSRCGDEFYARRDARFCSNRCRVAAHRASDGPPAELTTRDRWVNHRNKAPLRVGGGSFASTTNPATWGTYAQARAVTHTDGVGFVLNGDGVACVDLDKCLRPDGSLEPWAEAIIARCPRTYVEVSQSGRGLHIFGFAEVGKGRRRDGVEVYDRGRFIAITGRRFRDFPRRLADIAGVVATV